MLGLQRVKLDYTQQSRARATTSIRVPNGLARFQLPDTVRETVMEGS